MDGSPDPQTYRRTFLLTLFLLGSVAVGLGRLLHLQADDSVRRPSAEASVALLPAMRGNIYDRHGYLLAVSCPVYDVGVSPRQVGDAETLADQLASLLDTPRDEILAALTSDDTYVQLQRGVSAQTWDEITSWEVGALQADWRPGRVYPHGPLAACLLGFVTDDGKAAYGLEHYYDEVLAGKDGERRTVRDALGSLSYQWRPPRDGADLHLTLDRNVQDVVEQELTRAVSDTEADRGVAIVMTPATGAILGMAVAPAYDPNTREVEDQSLFTNSAISEPYEPGSVFKILTMAAAVDAGVASLDSTYYDGGVIVVGGERIENSDRMAYGQTSMHDLLAHSLNVGAAHLSTELGAFEFYEYVRRFGFAELTGVDLAYEVPGWLRLPGDRDWHESDLATNSFGQGLATTPLQVLSAVAAVANGGVLMRPYIVQRQIADQMVTETVPQEVRRVVSREAASDVTEMLVYAVDIALNTAAIQGYRVAGKSGTSQVSAPGGYDPEKTIPSFAGYVPADDPAFAILVALYETRGQHWGMWAAAPVFREIARRLLKLYAVPSYDVRLQLQGR